MIKKFIFVLIGAIILCQMAFYNLFPLTYSDTGTYMSSGFTGQVPADRPIVYGLFIRHSSLATTLWAVIFSQALIVSYLIHCVIEAYVTKYNKAVFFFSTILILVFTTGISQKVCTLMPDIFAATSGLSLILLCTKNNLKTHQLICIGIIYIFSNVVHYTHANIALLSIIVLGVLLLFKKIDKDYLNWKRLSVLLGLTVISLFLTPTIHYFHKGGFVTSKGKHVFLTGKLIQNGILVDFLKTHCDKNKYPLCPYKDSIAMGDFLWDGKSPLYKTGGWQDSEVEYNRMLGDLFRSPHHLMMFIYKSVESTLTQFFSFQTDVYYENYPLGVGGPYYQIEQYFNHQIADYLGSKQNQGRLDYKDLSARQNVLIWCCFILLIFFLCNKNKLKPSFFIILLVCLAFLFFNAAICGSLSLPNCRYQSRVIWLLPLVIGVIIFNSDFILIEKIKTFLNKKTDL